MLDLRAYRNKQVTLDELVAGLDRDDLATLTDEMVDGILAQIAGCIDADVIFEPLDPAANDPSAATAGEVSMPWTLGHVIVHTTASAEEAAALAAELARGVPPHGRSRAEVHWSTVRSIEACRQRLEESRRMRLASLGMWPDAPNLALQCQAWTNGPLVNAVGRFVLGLLHEDSHLGQIDDIVRQARAAR